MVDAVPLIETMGLTKAFAEGEHKKIVLNTIDLTIKQNEFVAITGPSGSGKSTLLSILGLLDEYDSGEYLLCGHSVTALSRYQLGQLRNRSIGWIFQNFNLVQDMTVQENVLLPLSYRKGFQSEDALLAVETALRAVGMADKARQYPAKLSGGQQQRIAIARAIVTNPELILADEPTGNLDSRNSETIFSLLQDLHQRGRTIVMVTHDEALAKLCPTQINLVDGQIVDTRRKHLVV